MKVSKDLDLAARVLMYLASKPTNAGTAVDELEKTLGVPSGVLEPLLVDLHRAKILRARRNTGRDEYLLRQPPSKIRLGMVVDAIRPRARWELSLVHDETSGVATPQEGGPAWSELEKVILKGLQDYTLDHLAWDTAFHLES